VIGSRSSIEKLFCFDQEPLLQFPLVVLAHKALPLRLNPLDRILIALLPSFGITVTMLSAVSVLSQLRRLNLPIRCSSFDEMAVIAESGSVKSALGCCPMIGGSLKGGNLGFSMDIKLVAMTCVEFLMGVSGILNWVSTNRLMGRLLTAEGRGGPLVVDLSLRPIWKDLLPFLTRPVLMNAAGLGLSQSKAWFGVPAGR